MATKGYRFKGHETFYFREGWLSKALIELDSNPEVNFLTNVNEGIAKLGVGANMVKSIKYWLLATNLIDKKSQLTKLGKLIAENDPYLENEFTLWLLHINLANNIQQATTWQMFFNKFKAETFKSEDVFRVLSNILESEQIDYTDKSLQNDISVLLSMYSKELPGDDPEENTVCPLAQLNLLKHTDNSYVKQTPELIEGIELIVLYLLSEFVEKEYDGQEYIKLSDVENILDNQMYLNRLLTSNILDELKGEYISVVKTAGLDMVYFNKFDIYEEITKYYLEINGRI